MPDVRSYLDLGGMPDIRSYSDLGGSTICRITVIIQTWGEFVLLYFEYLFLFRPWGFYYNPDICSYTDQGFYIIPDIRSNSDQVESFTIFRISGLIQTRGILQYSGYLFLFSPGGGEFVLLYFEYPFLFRPGGVLQYSGYPFLFRPEGFYYILDIRSNSDQGGFPTIFRKSVLIQTWRVLQYSKSLFLFRPGGGVLYSRYPSLFRPGVMYSLYPFLFRPVRGVLLYSGYQFLFRPRGSCFFSHE